MLSDQQNIAMEADIGAAAAAIIKLRVIKEPHLLVTEIKTILARLGGNSFVYYSRFTDQAGKERNRYLVGCPPEFCQQYNARKWREIDPILAYAMHHMRPIFCSDLGQFTDGQKELIAAAKAEGFPFAIAVPARHATQDRLGILYVGTATKDMEPKLSAAQGVLMHLSSELLDWVISQLREEELGDVKIDALDQSILRYCYQGFTAEHIAVLQDLPVSRIRNRIRRLNEKFHTTSNKAAVTRAIEMGLLRVHECLSDTWLNQPDSH